MKESTNLAQANSLFHLGQISEAILIYKKIIHSEEPSIVRQCAEFNLLLADKRLKKYSKIFDKSHLQDASDWSLPRKLDRAYSRAPIAPGGAVVYDELISIIMPLYNNQRYVKRSINSCLSQTGVNVELIIVDDGSSDWSLEVAHQAARGAENIKIISTLKNFGCYYARNIALLNATGKYITLLDSDDIMLPDRLRIQLDVIKNNKDSIACLGLSSKWTSDFSRRLKGPSYAENSLMWDHGLVKNLGFYDSVRFGGDTEFRTRLVSAYGSDAIARIDKEIYFLRTVDTSLAMSAETSAFRKQLDGSLRLSLCNERQLYQERFNSWHSSNNPRVTGCVDSLKISFPLRSRPFELGGNKQNASPALDSRIVGMMATFEKRLESLRQTFHSIIHQLDHLVVYLNEYHRVPDFLMHHKVEICRSQDCVGDLRDNGKFFRSDLFDNAYLVTLDDDIIYPPDYILTLVHHIEVLGRSSIVGCHGVIFPEGAFGDLRQRKVFPYWQATGGQFVDLIGTGTTAWHTSTLKVSLDRFKSRGVCDLWFASIAASESIPMYSIPKRRGWLESPFEQQDSLWKEAVSDSAHYFESFAASMAKTDYKAVRHAAEIKMLSKYSILALKYYGHNGFSVLSS